MQWIDMKICEFILFSCSKNKLFAFNYPNKEFYNCKFSKEHYANMHSHLMHTFCSCGTGSERDLLSQIRHSQTRSAWFLAFNWHRFDTRNLVKQRKPRENTSNKRNIIENYIELLPSSVQIRDIGLVNYKTYHHLNGVRLFIQTIN